MAKNLVDLKIFNLNISTQLIEVIQLKESQIDLISLRMNLLCGLNSHQSLFKMKLIIFEIIEKKEPTINVRKKISKPNQFFTKNIA